VAGCPPPVGELGKLGAETDGLEEIDGVGSPGLGTVVAPPVGCDGSTGCPPPVGELGEFGVETDGVPGEG
jgi:hypothetical protein